MTHTSGQQHDRTALVLYGTETGNSEEVAEELEAMLEKLHFVTRISSMHLVELSDLLNYTVVIVAISTTGLGEFPRNSRLLWKSLLRKRLPPDCLERVSFTIFGLGDTSYAQFNWAARKLHKRLEQLGAKELHPRGEGDEQHENGSIFVPWLAALRARLLSSYPLPQGLQPIRPEVSLPPKYTLRILETVDFTTIDTSITMPASSAFRLTQNQRVTPINHEQDVRHMKFTTPCGDIPYLPGDVLAIHPSNSDKDVNELIDLMEWHEVADTPLAFNSPTRSGLSARDGTTLRRLLKYKLDITAVPKLRFVAFMSDWCVDPTHKERLLEYLNPADTEEFLDFATRPRRTILEILHDLPVKFPWEHAVTIFPLIKPRQYSICSGGALNRHSGNDLVDVQLLIAVVKYRTVLKKFRTGLCTQYLAALPEGSLIEAVHIQGSMMDKAMTTDPAIYIATGTGIAPIRSLIWQQAEDGPEKLAENSLLVFGCRNESADYFFKHEWQVLSLKVLTAFSRDQRQKIYVQDVISMNGRAIWQLLKQRARVFVCGSAGKMPKAVRLAILKVIKAGLEMDDQPNNDADADNWLKDHERAGRYFQEVW